VVWERILVSLDPSVRGLDVSGLERRLADYQSIQDYTERPDVDLVGVACSAFEYFWCDVVWRTTNGPLLLSVKIELCGETKVSQFDLHLIVEEQVAELEISVDHTVGVQVLERVDHLLGVALDLELVQALAPLQKLVHALVLAQLEQDVHILTVFKEMKKLGNIWMLDRPVNFDLTHQLLLRPAPLQRGLLDDLGRAHRLRVHLHELVALGEATLSKELALHVLPVADLTIGMLYALLDELGGGVARVTPAGRVEIGLAPAVGVACDEARRLSSSRCTAIASRSWRLRRQSVGTVVLLRHFG
jgi:hypothetical protein